MSILFKTHGQPIFNLTQHTATQEQLAQGVVEPNPEVKAAIQKLLTISVDTDLDEVVDDLAWIAVAAKCPHVMLGGAPFLMGMLERALNVRGLNVLYAFSERVSEEVVKPDGTIEKVSRFKHLGFVHNGVYPMPPGELSPF